MDPARFFAQHPRVYRVSVLVSVGFTAFAAVRAYMDRRDKMAMARDTALALVSAGEAIGMTRMRARGLRAEAA